MPAFDDDNEEETSEMRKKKKKTLNTMRTKTREMTTKKI